MTGYLLDTNIPLYLEDPTSPFNHAVIRSFQRLQDDDRLFISVLSLYELYYGMALRKRDNREQFATQTLLVIEEIKKRFSILPLTGKEAPVFGEIKAHYKERPKRKEDISETIKKHDFDFILASTAIEYDLTIVSNDSIFYSIKELFPNLRIENWASD
jgi:predicted nucleic acid-binding protein